MDRDLRSDGVDDLLDVPSVGGDDRIVSAHCSLGDGDVDDASIPPRAINPPTARACCSLNASTLQPSSSLDKRCCGPPRHASASTPAGTVGGSPLAIAARCSAHSRRSSRSAAISAPVS